MEIKIFDYGMNGEGVAKLDGKIILVPNALKGEEIEFEIVDDYKNYATAKNTKIISASKNRVEPICPHFFDCGGCSLQHMNYQEQLEFKTQLIKKTFKKILNLDVDVKKCVACNNCLNYRNKMSFSVNSSICGMNKPNSNDIVEIEKCHIADEDINKVFHIFVEFLKTLSNHTIKNLVTRKINNQILVGVVSKKHEELLPFWEKLSQQFEKIGVYEIINTRNDSVVLSGKTKHLFGIKNIKICDFGLTYFVDLIGFHQTNLEIQSKLYKKVLNYIDDNSIIINGFSGQGLLSGILAQKAKQVIGIEINENSHLSAEKLKKDNKLDNLKNICGDFHKYVTKELKNANTVILDPTKKGCGKDVMKEINGVENIIYISCNPIALCKDLSVIKDDYVIEEIAPFDMFPQTVSVETLVKLKKLRRK